MAYFCFPITGKLSISGRLGPAWVFLIQEITQKSLEAIWGDQRLEYHQILFISSHSQRCWIKLQSAKLKSIKRYVDGSFYVI